MERVTIAYNSYLAYIQSPIDPELENIISKQLTWINKSKDYLNHKRNMNYNSREHCYDRVNKSFLTGLIPRVSKILMPYYKVDYVQKYQSIVIDTSNIELPNWLWPHQVEAIKAALNNTRGMISIPTGGGKTTVASLIVKLMGPETKIIVTVPKATLMKAMKKTLSKFIDEEIGEVGDNTQNWQRVTVGIINSLSQEKYYKQLKDTDVLIFDEAHRAASSMYVSTLSNCKQLSYVYGLSATPTRGNGDDIVLEGVTGPLIYTAKESDLVNNKCTMQPICIFVEYKTPIVKYNKSYEYFDETLKKNVVSYATADKKPDPSDVYIKSIVQNEERNKLICDLYIKYISNSILPAFILVDHIEHGVILQSMLKELGYEIPFVHGKTKKLRVEVLDKIRSMTIKGTIASSVFNEGEDINCLGLVINAGGGRSKNDTIQKIGRVVRTHQLKTHALYIDIYDKAPFYLTSAANDRMLTAMNRHGNKSTSIKTLDQTLMDITLLGKRQ